MFSVNHTLEIPLIISFKVSDRLILLRTCVSEMESVKLDLRFREWLLPIEKDENNYES